MKIEELKKIQGYLKDLIQAQKELDFAINIVWSFK